MIKFKSFYSGPLNMVSFQRAAIVICNYVTISCKYRPKSLKNVSSILLNLWHKNGQYAYVMLCCRLYWKKKTHSSQSQYYPAIQSTDLAVLSNFNCGTTHTLAWESLWNNRKEKKVNVITDSSKVRGNVLVQNYKPFCKLWISTVCKLVDHLKVVE